MFVFPEGKGGLKKRVPVHTPTDRDPKKNTKFLKNLNKVQHQLIKLKNQRTSLVSTNGESLTPEIPKYDTLELEECLKSVDMLPNRIRGVIRHPWAPFIFTNPRKKQNLPDVYLPIFPKTTDELSTKEKFSDLGTNVSEGKLLIVEGEVFRRWAEAFLEAHGSINLGPVKSEDALLVAPTAVINSCKNYHCVIIIIVVMMSHISYIKQKDQA